MMDVHLTQVLEELNTGLFLIYGQRLRQVLLYGSQARGEATSESDIDVMVVLDDPVDPLQEIRNTENLIADLSLYFDTVISCLFLGVEEFNNKADLFLRKVLQDAIPV